MDTSKSVDTESDAKDLFYRPGCSMMAAGRPGPEMYKNCSEMLLESTKELLVGLVKCGMFSLESIYKLCISLYLLFCVLRSRCPFWNQMSDACIYV